MPCQCQMDLSQQGIPHESAHLVYESYSLSDSSIILPLNCSSETSISPPFQGQGRLASSSFMFPLEKKIYIALTIRSTVKAKYLLFCAGVIHVKMKQWCLFQQFALVIRNEILLLYRIITCAGRSAFFVRVHKLLGWPLFVSIMLSTLTSNYMKPLFMNLRIYMIH